MECDYCQLLKKGTTVIYEDSDVVVAVKESALAPGQITVFPRQHLTILEMVPDAVLAKCAVLANKVGVAAFETMGAHGTNIIAQNGLGAGQDVPHFALEVVPRRENDGLNLSWQPKQIPEDEMETSFLMLKEEGDKLVNIGKESPKKKEAPAEAKTEKVAAADGKDNYLLKALKRRP